MPEQRVVKVTIEYERSVRVGAEQVLLRDVLKDVALLQNDNALGNAYRQLYGRGPAFDPSTANNLLKEGKTVLVTGSTTRGSSYQVLTPSALADLLNSAWRAGTNQISDEVMPVDKDGNVRTFSANDVTLDEKGQWRLINGNKGPARTAQLAAQLLLGGTPVQLTPEDLEKIERLKTDARRLGVSPDELIKMGSLGGGLKIAKGGKVVVWWRGTPIDDSALAISGETDALRARGPRPGGENLWSNPYAQVDDADAVPVRSAEYDSFIPNHPPLASRQKDDSYAVLRVVSGFSPAAGDVLSPGKNEDFKVLFQTNHFLVESAQEGQAERVSLVETFGETLLYAFGERPKMYTYTGVLMDTQGLNWLNEWREAYRTKFRATASLKLKARVFFVYRDVAREGIIVANMASLSSAELGLGRFSFQMFVMREYFLDGRPELDSQTNLPTGLEKALKADTDEVLYKLSGINDVTPKADAPKTADGVKNSAAMRAAIAAENKISANRKAEIEAKIEADAFPKGKYTTSSGQFELSLSEADVDAAKWGYEKRFFDEQWDASHPAQIVEVK